MTQPTTSGGIRPLYVLIIAVVAFGLGVGAGIFLWINIFAGSGEPSRDIRDVAPTLAAEEPAAATELMATEEAAATLLATTVVGLQGSQPISTEEAVEATVTGESEASAPSGATGGVIFRIVPEQSEARFALQEDLRGQRVDVIGITNEVAGDIRVNAANPSASEVGVIVINARTLETDQPFRNQALRASILRSGSDAYEFITFTPTAITGLPEASVNVGDTITFEVTGDLKIIEVTNSVTFEVTVTLDSETQISGTGTTTILYKDFNITIPNAPGVANITDEVTLTITFVATQVEA